MICPQCRQYTPDNSFRCIRCGSAIKKEGVNVGGEGYPSARPESKFSFRPWMLVPLVLLGALAYFFFAHQNRIQAVNAYNPGAELDIETYLQKGKTNIVDFYSEYCPPCREISPLLKKLDKQRPDIVVLAVDINRKDVKGIDWQSPLARQYELKSIPHFQIYDAAGKLSQEGQEAYVQVMLLLAGQGIR